MAVTKITFKAAELRRLLVNASLFAAPVKECLPALSVVRFEWSDDHLFAVATNRYIVSWEMSWPVETEGREPFSIATVDAKRLVAILPKNDNGIAEAVLQYDSDAGHVEVACYGVFRADAVEAEFPRWRGLVDRFVPGERKTVVFDAKWLALLAKVDGDGMPVHFEFADAFKAQRVSIGEAFKALVMPIKHAG